MPHLRRLVGLACLAVLGSACGSEPPEARASDSGPRTFNMSLATRGESGIQGLVTVSPGSDAYTVKMELMGLTGGTTYTAALHAGTCDSPGALVTELNDATSGSIGIGSSTTSIPRDRIDEADALHIQARLPDGTVAACGDVPTENLG